jgi:hypothetical protein
MFEVIDAVRTVSICGGMQHFKRLHNAAPSEIGGANSVYNDRLVIKHSELSSEASERELLSISENDYKIELLPRRLKYVGDRGEIRDVERLHGSDLHPLLSRKHFSDLLERDSGLLVDSLIPWHAQRPALVGSPSRLLRNVLPPSFSVLRTVQDHEYRKVVR